MRVYFDHGATTLVDPRVLKVMIPYFDKDFGNPSSLHSSGRKASEAVDKARKVIADAINASPEEVVFTSGGTESDNLAIKGYALANKSKGDHIITSCIEHPAVLNACKWLETQGFKITYLGVDKEGFVSLDELKKSITPETILISIMHANNEIGTIQQIREIGRIARENNIVFHTDAVQSFTKVPLNVRDDFIDLASFSAHKIHGPKGVGALFVRNGVKLMAIASGGGHEHGLRAGTENVPGIVGFAKAVSLNPEIDKMKKLRDYLISEVLKIDGVTLNGPKERRLCNNANFSFEKVEGESLLMMLDSKGIAVSTGSACSSKSLKASHVLTSIGLRIELCHGSLRITIGRENTKEEADYFIKCLVDSVKKLRSVSGL